MEIFEHSLGLCIFCLKLSDIKIAFGRDEAMILLTLLTTPLLIHFRAIIRQLTRSSWGALSD